jgi:hypothetical protein
MQYIQTIIYSSSISTMKKQFYTFCFILVVFIANAAAQSSWTPIYGSGEQAAEVKLLSSNVQETTIRFSLNGFNQMPVETPNGTEMIISLGDGVQITEKGMPDLAKLVTSIIIPDIDEMQVTILDAKYYDYRDIAVAPSKGHFFRNINPDDVPFTYGDVYNQDAFWPGELAQLEDPFIMRDFRGQTVTVFPYQYNPVSQTLRVYTDITLEVTSTGREGIDPLVRKRDEIVLEPEFGNIYNRFFLNMQDASKSYPMLDGEEGSLLIIAHDSFMDAMQPFVNWKRTLGRKTEIVPKSEAGANANAIKAFVADYYDANEDFAYLLLVGDGPQIPPMVTSSGQSDNAYGYLVGSNSYNDIFVGRFSAESIANVETQVQRMIEYERDITEADTWLSTGMGIARNEGAGGGHNGEADYVHMDLIRDTLLNFTYDIVHRNYDGNVPGMPNTTAAEISTNINDGLSIINFCNHGTVTGWSVAGYNIGHVNNLTNVGQLPWIWAVACVNGNFANNFCFAEAWLRATHDGEPTGAIGMMASTINQAWQPPMTGQDEMNSILSEESIPHGPVIKRTYGGVSINGSMYMIPQHGSSGTQTHDTWVLFGDPTLMVRTAAPEPFTPDYNPVALIGWSSFNVAGLEDGAHVSFTVENDGVVEILGTAVAENGTANIVFDEPLSEPAMATLAITGFNKITYMNDEISVIPPEGPYVLLNEFSVEGSTAFDETVMFSMEIENVGIHTAENLQLVLSSDDEYVNIIEDTYMWGNLPEYESDSKENIFLVHIDKNIPDQHKPVFDLLFVDANEDSWDASFNFTVNAPAYEVLSVMVDDEETGNNNGNLDPGEIAHLHITIHNSGHADISGLMASGAPESEYLVFLDDAVSLGDMAMGEEKTVEITVMGSHQSLPETTETFSLDLVTTDYLNKNMIDIVVGILPEYLMGDDNFAFDCYGKFYDSGGADENYGASDDHIITFYPQYPDNHLHFVFDEFHIEDDPNTFMRIYDGPNTSWPMIGSYNGTNSPGEFTSTNSQGAITIRFKSGSSNTSAGWAARFYCTNPPLMFENISAYPQHIVAGEQSQLSAMATGGGENLTFTWSPAESLNDPTIPTPVASPSVTTEYTLEISDGETSVEGSITIHVTSSGDMYDITFDITDEFGYPVDDAVISLGEMVNDAGDYHFHNVPEGVHNWSVSRLCYETQEGDMNINSSETVEIELALDHTPGDANGDGQVNALDIIATANYWAHGTAENFCFYNADVNDDSEVNILDVIGTINIFASGKLMPHSSLYSETAHVFIHNSGISIESDGTLAGIQFELSGITADEFNMESELEGFELIFVSERGTAKAMLFSIDNRPIPEGLHRLVSFNHELPAANWNIGMAGNLNGVKVPIIIHNEEATGIDETENIELSVYPNPAHSSFTVEANETIRQIRLTDISGQTLLLTEVDDYQSEINVSNLRSGIYLIEVQTGSGITTKRVQIMN